MFLCLKPISKIDLLPCVLLFYLFLKFYLFRERKLYFPPILTRATALFFLRNQLSKTREWLMAASFPFPRLFPVELESIPPLLFPFFSEGFRCLFNSRKKSREIAKPYQYICLSVLLIPTRSLWVWKVFFLLLVNITLFSSRRFCFWAELVPTIRPFFPLSFLLFLFLFAVQTVPLSFYAFQKWDRKWGRRSHCFQHFWGFPQTGRGNIRFIWNYITGQCGKSVSFFFLVFNLWPISWLASPKKRGERGKSWGDWTLSQFFPLPRYFLVWHLPYRIKKWH